MTGRTVAARGHPDRARADGEPAKDLFRLLLVTNRPAVQSFFASLTERSPRPLAITHMHVDPGAVGRQPLDVERPAAAAVDVAVEPTAAMAVCRELHERWKELPIVAVLCCPNSVTPWNLRAMIASGVNAVTDFEATPDETLRALESVAHGGSVLQLRRGRGALLRDVLAAREARVEAYARLLELVARGLPEREIGRRLHLSPHTVKHHIETVRGQVGVRNRIELAAWAGRHGFYSPDT